MGLSARPAKAAGQGNNDPPLHQHSLLAAGCPGGLSCVSESDPLISNLTRMDRASLPEAEVKRPPCWNSTAQ